jgi:hypothetical protein
MKRKLLLFALIMASCTTMFGQAFIWEAFDGGQMPPSGWTIDGYNAQWSISNSNNAGGTAPEAMFTYTTGNGTSRLISPSLDLTGLTTVKFSFRHYYDYYAAGPKIGVATRSQGGAWNMVWEVTPNGNIGPEQKDIDISNGDVGSSTFQVCIYITGNLYNLDYWYIDNILLFNPLNLDAGMSQISTPQYFMDPVPVTGSLMNFGTTTISSAEINWQVDGGQVFSSTFTGLSVPTLGTYDFTCTDLLDAQIGAHNLVVWVNKVNGDLDDDHTNDTLNKAVNKVCNTIPRIPCFEEFTSSTCAPCAAFNSGFVPWCQSHDELITLVKYQMNWPGAGDPYYTAEGGDRRNYYGVTWVPWLVTNGSFVNTDVPSVQAAFDEAITKPGLLDIAASHTISGTTINVNASILPFANFTNARVHVIVFEYITTQNVATNGETEFHHVMMKMMPDAFGTTVDFSDRVPYTLTLSADLAGTNVEEFTDLGVLVLVQDFTSREIFQSAYSVENAAYNSEAHLSSIEVDGTAIAGFDPNTFIYDYTMAGGTVITPDVAGIPIDTNATVIVVPAYQLPGTTTIDVFGEDLVSHQVYSVNFAWAVGQNENTINPVRVYPNPTAGMIYIMGAGHSRISVISASGVEVARYDDFTGTSLNLNSLSSGVYYMNITKTDGSVIKHKIVIVK